MTVSIVWFRRDLRLEDNDALAHALIMTRQVIPVYIHAPEEEQPWAKGTVQRWWLHHSLAALDASLRRLRSRLVIRRARTSLAGLRALVQETGAGLVCWHRRYEPVEMAREDVIEAAMVRLGVTVQTFPGHLLREPESMPDGIPGLHREFSTFSRAVQAKLELPARPTPSRLPAVPRGLASLSLAALDLLPDLTESARLAARWQPGEAGAHRLLRTLRKWSTVKTRNSTAVHDFTHLAPHLYFGEITPARAWRQFSPPTNRRRGPTRQHHAATIRRELLRREFISHLQALGRKPPVRWPLLLRDFTSG